MTPPLEQRPQAPASAPWFSAGALTHTPVAGRGQSAFVQISCTPRFTGRCEISMTTWWASFLSTCPSAPWGGCQRAGAAKGSGGRWTEQRKGPTEGSGWAWKRCKPWPDTGVPDCWRHGSVCACVHTCVCTCVCMRACMFHFAVWTYLRESTN